MADMINFCLSLTFSLTFSLNSQPKLGRHAGSTRIWSPQPDYTTLSRTGTSTSGGTTSCTAIQGSSSALISRSPIVTDGSFVIHHTMPLTVFLLSLPVSGTVISRIGIVNKTLSF